MKKLLTACLLLVLISVGFSTIAQANTTTIYIDGTKLNVATATKNGATLVPLRAVSEKLGLKVKYNSDGTIVIEHPHRPVVVTHKVESTSATQYYDGVQKATKTFTTPSVLQNGTTYVPIRFVELLDAQVHWDAATSTVNVYSYELKMNQYTIMASLAYNADLKNFANGKTKVTTMIPELSGGYKSIFANVKKHFSIYTTDTPTAFAKKMGMEDWVVKKQSMNSNGFKGASFYNTKTGEVAIAYAGSEDLSDYAADVISYFSSDWLKNVSNPQKEQARSLFLDTYKAGTSVTLIGHSLGGNLAQGVAAYYPNNYNKLVTFNAYGSGLTPTKSVEYQKATNYVIKGDIVQGLRSQYGTRIAFLQRQTNNTDPKKHSMYNFYSYFFTADSKYWTATNYGIPYAK